MTTATTNDYWISPSALSITLNAMNQPDYVQASCVSGAQILVYVKGIIDYDAGHNYRRWTLAASPTVFNSTGRKYVYAAVPRSAAASNAVIVFPSEQVDVYGLNEAGEQIGSTDYWYIYLQGIISSSGDNGTQSRDWEQRVATGYLSSDEAASAEAFDFTWYSSVDKIVTFVKDLTMKAGTKFYQLFAKAVTIVSGGSITFEDGGTLTGVAADGTALTAEDKAVTPKYLDDNALSKKHDDETPYALTMQALTARGTADIFGNTVIRGSLTVGTADAPRATGLVGDLTIGIFNKGVQGAKVDFYGNAEFESIAARSFLEVPELRYNRTTITVGNKWQTKGGGIIERVWNIDTSPSAFTSAAAGVAKLKLEDGEAGAVAVGDKCQGVFHFAGKDNDAADVDDKNGNFHFCGFTTVYFLVKEIYTADTLPQFIKDELTDGGESIAANQYFSYELRAATCAALPETDQNRWTDGSHPQPSMHFAAYANAVDSERQSARLTTTTYQLHLTGMTGWTYTQANIQLIIGWLDGFTLLQKVWDKEKKEFVQAQKALSGEGIATGNIYMWGTIDQFDREPSLIWQQLYFQASDNPDSQPAGITVADSHLSYDLGAWERTPITPSATARFVWQQWLYAYSDGTYSVSDVAFHSTDPTALAVQLNPNIVSVALSDWYDAENPDSVSFTLTARLLSGSTPLAISEATAVYSGTAETSVTATYSPDRKTAQLAVTIDGFVGVGVDGATPEDAFLTVTLASLYGTASAMATIAQNREGDSGQDGANGNGIASQTSLFAATSRSEVTSYDDLADQWKETFPQADEQTPYVWKCVKTVYTQTGEAYSLPELVTTYQSGLGQNLIDNAAFTSAQNLGAWDVQSKYTAADGVTELPTDEGAGAPDTAVQVYSHNSYHDTCKATAAQVKYKDVLSQVVHNPKQGVSKLEGGKWYTLSFWAKRTLSLMDVQETSSEYGFAKRTLYLEKGVPYSISVIGCVDQQAVTDGKELRTYVFKTGWTEAQSVSIATTAQSTAQMTFTPQTTGEYQLVSYLYDQTDPRTGKATVFAYAVTDGRDLVTYVYPGVVDTAQKFIVDRKEQASTPADCGVTWQLSPLWTRHSVTFKTAEQLSEANVCAVLFRLLPSPHAALYREVRICMPKLEAGMFATGFADGQADLKGERGYTGVTVRRGEWEEGALYRNDSADGSQADDGNRYLDEVSVTDMASGTAKWYLARKAHNNVAASQANKPSGNGNDLWEAVNDMRPLRTSFADITTAVVQYLQASQIQVTDENGTAYGAFGGGTGQDYPLWFGAETAADAVAKFNRKGDLWLGSNFSVVSGNVTAQSGTFTAGTFNQGTFNDITINRRSTFYGFMRKGFLEITADNFAQYTVDDATDPFADATLDFRKMGTGVIVRSVPSGLSGTPVLYMPYFLKVRTDVLFDAYNEERSYVGCQFLIYNRTAQSIAVSGGVVEDADGATVSVSIGQGSFALFECVLGIHDSTEQVVWKVVKTGASYGTD